MLFCPAFFEGRPLTSWLHLIPQLLVAWHLCVWTELVPSSRLFIRKKASVKLLANEMTSGSGANCSWNSRLNRNQGVFSNHLGDCGEEDVNNT